MHFLLGIVDEGHQWGQDIKKLFNPFTAKYLNVYVVPSTNYFNK